MLTGKGKAEIALPWHGLAIRVADMLQFALTIIGSDHCKDTRAVCQESGSIAALLAPARTVVSAHLGHIATGHSQARAESRGGPSPQHLYLVIRC